MGLPPAPRDGSYSDHPAGDQADIEEVERPAADLTDGRKAGEFQSRYPISAWAQIIAEFIYLSAVLGAIASFLIVVGWCAAAPEPTDHRALFWGLEYPRDRKFLIWISLALSGSAGGCAFSLKWLYHSVAKHTWNRDRWIWRIVVPGLSGMFASFVCFMIASGLVPFLNEKVFDSFYRSLRCGFLLGYFSDNVLASLQNLANRWFGTVDLAFRRHIGQ